jgi:peptidoglycan/xylan/chitin deacetylase (PgdA/CDA1 family)
MKRSVILTFDYEVFMGRDTGTVENCVIRPTEEILSVLKLNKAKAIFFVDAPWLLFIKENFAGDFSVVARQLKDIVDSGSDVELHIHPQWINAEKKDGKIHFTSFEHYRLHSLGKDEITALFKKAASVLEGITGKKVTCFRAGGWCIEPFGQIKEAFEAVGIKFDFSVVPGIKLSEGKEYDYDFTAAPRADKYKFRSNVQQVDETGMFTEFPLGTYNSNVLFRTVNKGLLVLSRDKMFGDGRGLKEKTAKNTLDRLFSFSKNMLTLDKTHNIVFKLILKLFFRKRDLLVIVSHPKTVSGQALKNLRFITASGSTLGVKEIETGQF